MEDIKRYEMGFPDYQKSKRNFSRKSSREPTQAEKNKEVMKVPTILKKGVNINQVLNKENGVSNDELNGSINSPARGNSIQKSHQINPLAKEFTYEPKIQQHATKTQNPDPNYQQSDTHNSQNYYQNYPQLLKKASVTDQAVSIKEAVTKALPATNPSTNVVRAIEKAREYSASWVPRVMKEPIKLILNFNWASQLPNVLKEQCNYVVVGVLGAQSTGKSTLLSHLAGFPPKSGHKMLFEAPAVEQLTNHSTQGVDMYVTQERMILLDSQAVFSMSSTAVLKKKKRFVGEKQFYHDSVDAQSLQLASFFLSVCNVVIVVIDWFIDDQIIKLLSIAEMLKPKATSNLDDVQDPHVVFVLNRATEADWLSVRHLDSLLGTLISKDTPLRFTGMFARKEEGEERGKEGEQTASHNIILLPQIQQPNNNNNDTRVNNNNTDDKNTTMQFLTTLSHTHHNYRPSYQQQIRHLRNTILSLPRDQMFNKLSEKNWLQYAAKAWDLVRKSSFISDYSRLLS